MIIFRRIYYVIALAFALLFLFVMFTLSILRGEFDNESLNPFDWKI